MKKGFTLIELLGVIVILSFLIVIVGFGVTKFIKDSKKDLNSTQRIAILEAAKIWSVDNLNSLPSSGCDYVQVQTFIDEGIISNVKDLNTDTVINGYYVKVCKIDNNGVDDYSYEIYEAIP